MKKLISLFLHNLSQPLDSLGQLVNLMSIAILGLKHLLNSLDALLMLLGPLADLLVVLHHQVFKTRLVLLDLLE